MTKAPLPLLPYRVVTDKLPGAPYTASAVYVMGAPGGEPRLVYSRLGRIDDAEAQERVRAFMEPQPMPTPPTFYGRTAKKARDDEDL